VYTIIRSVKSAKMAHFKANYWKDNKELLLKTEIWSTILLKVGLS
jgi:hypothetical protein